MSFFSSKFGKYEGVIRNMFLNDQTDKIIISKSREIDNEIYNSSNILNSDTEEYYLSESNVNSGQWLTIEFSDRWISLSQFTFASNPKGYPSKIELEAYNDKNYKWISLYTNTDEDLFKNGDSLITVSPNFASRKFKFINKGRSLNTNDEGAYSMRIRAIDLFGVMTKCNDNCLSPNNYQKLPNIIQTCQYYNMRLHLINLFIILI